MSSAPTSDRSAIVAQGLVKRFDRGRVQAVNELDLEIGFGEFVAICGPSGCGKTTLLNLIAAIERPDAGTLHVAGRYLTKLSESEANEHRQSVVGLVFQLHNLLPNLTALENVQVPMLAAGRSPHERHERARSLLGRVGLSHRQDALPTTLSGGERQRVAIARALANEPQILLADEPTGALDSVSGERLLDLLDELQRNDQTTLIVVTHDEHIAARATRVLHMLDGKITASQTSTVGSS
jgi:ABC-type lipoprotein export system ATPase subunit